MRRYPTPVLATAAALAVAAFGCKQAVSGPAPAPASVTPSIVCSEQLTTELTLSGSGFSPTPVDGLADSPRVAMPKISLRKSASLDGSSLSGELLVLNPDPTDATNTSVRWTSSTEMRFTVAPSLALGDGLFDVTVENATGGVGTLARAFAAAPPPVLASVQPTPICTAQGENVLAVAGDWFLRIGSALPTVRIGALDLTPTSATGCTALVTPSGDVERCTGLTVAVAMNALSPGTYPVSVTNPPPASCVSSQPVTLEVVPPPVVTDIDTTAVCTGGGSFTITGEHLQRVTATLTDSTGGVVQAASVSVNADGTSALVTFGAGLKPETYTLSVTGVSGCSSSLDTKTVTVTPGPLVFYVDPPAIYSGVSIRATISVSGVTSSPTSVSITPAGGGTETVLTDATWDPARPTVIQATLPAGLAAGSHDVFVRGVGSCDAFLGNAFRVVSDTFLALADPALQPAFGEAGKDVAVTVFAKRTADLAPGEVNFQATPRVYLSSAALAVATPLRAVAFADSTQLTAVIPGLPSGTYDLVVVNPDATVGFRPGAFRFTTVPPPVVSDVSPTQLTNDVPTAITIAGANLAPAAAMDVLLTCKDPNAVVTMYDLAVDEAASGASSLRATVPAGITHGSACTVKVTNVPEATFDEWSALSVTNPASKLPPFLAGSRLNEGRRAPAMATGRATSEARFVYAIGGDDGTVLGAKSSIEAAPLGRFGEIGAWEALQNPLPGATTLAAAHRVGRHVFLVGGHDGVAPTREIRRATILDPLAAPAVSEVDLRFASNALGLAAGAWTYAVAAVYDALDAENPSGESLPSEAITVYAPDVPGGVEIELRWPTVLGADGATPAAEYRVYRTTTVNGALGSLRLLATVPPAAASVQSFTDTNPAAFADGAKAPFRIGALGTWKKVGDLVTPRAAFAFVTATDPACAPFWYAIGGWTNAATESSTFEYAGFDAAAGAPLAFAEVSSTGFAARREHGAWVANASTAPGLVTDPASCGSYVYAAYGASGAVDPASALFVTNARYARVKAGGALESDEATPVEGRWLEAMVAPASRSLAGYRAFMTANGAYAIGGRDGAGPTPDAIQASLCDKTGCTPRLQTWNDASFDMSAARYLPGMARLGAFVYLAGGVDGSWTLLTSTEMNIR